MTNVYFLEADDHTAPAVSCEEKNTILVPLVTWKIKCYCCNLGGGGERGYCVFFICRYGLLFQSLFIYSIYSVYVRATAMMKIILTPHFDLLNATRVEIYIVIKANIFFSDFSVFLYALIVAECFCRTAETVKCGFCSSSFNCLLSGLSGVTSSTCKIFGVQLQRLTQSLFKWKEFIEGDGTRPWALTVLGYSNSTLEPRATRWEVE